MPWSAKAQDLLKQQYAAVGSASRASLKETANVFQQTISNLRDVTALLDRTLEREVAVNCYVDAYRRYCWNVQAATDLKLAPFHLLASEGHLQIKTAVRYETRRQMY